MAKKTPTIPVPQKAVARSLIDANKLKARFKKIKLVNVFAIASVFILGATAILWAWLGASLQQANADQLVNSYLFENSQTLHGSILPGAHSFLVKWPLFYILKVINFSPAGFIVLTIISVLITVGVLTLILYKMERRLAVFGVLCLALASVLLMVPAQPYAGALLPVNMAMLATRNLEYVIYIAAIILLIKSAGKRNIWFWLAAATMGLLTASDHLFLGISIVSAVIGLSVYAIKKIWDATALFSYLLLISIIGVLAGIVILSLISASGFIHISSSQNGSPFTTVTGGKNLLLGILYAGLGLFTNFGANPAYDATVVRTIPHHLQSGLLGLGGPAFVINLLIFFFGLYAAYILFRSSIITKKSKRLVLDKYASLALVLLYSCFAAVALFILSNHYYAVDSRYLTITLFTLFVCAAQLARHRNWNEEVVLLVGGIIGISIFFGIISNVQIHNKQLHALDTMKARNALVAQALKSHPVETLVGDYWRVVPARQESGNKFNITPMANCVTARDALTSSAWNKNLSKTSFAYLLSLDGSLTDYPNCNLTEVLQSYGRPNSSILIDGTLSNPKELLLVYDHGINRPPKSAAALAAPSTILPIDLAELSGTTCKNPTIMNIVAHQDDDLLFMNPDLMKDIKAGRCIRTVYLTAGDSGFEKYYWLSRETGTENAYSLMLGKNKQPWVERIVKVNARQFITIANPKGNNSISIIFVHLPDGGLNGEGYSSTNYESLQKLDYNQIQTIHSIDKQSQYTSPELVSLLSTLMHLYQPTEIHTQSNYAGIDYPDHSDHLTVGRFAQKAHSEYEAQQFNGEVSIPIKFYIGYPIHEMAENISDGELTAKEAVFLQYARYDGGVCQTAEQCIQTPTYGAYLSRQYQNSY